MNKRIKTIIACTLIVSAVQSPLSVFANMLENKDANNQCTEAEENTEKAEKTEKTEQTEQKDKSTWGKHCKDKEDENNDNKEDLKDEKKCPKKCEVKEDIVDTAIKAGNFKTLVSALKAADLVDLLKQKGPYTVFAPTDEAFGKLSKETLDDLLKCENKDKLKSRLTYHVYPGLLKEKELKGMDSKKITMSNGKEATITVKDNDVYIDDVKVGKKVKTSNGIIYVIDEVLKDK